MDYQRIYDQIIERAKARESLDGYSEKHHIIPKSLGGTNEKSNLVRLTGREHFLAHCLLARNHGGTQWYALIRMKGLNRRYTNSRLYAKARLEYSKFRTGKPNTWNKPSLECHRLGQLALKSKPRWNKGGLLSSEHREFLRTINMGNTNASGKRLAPQTEEHREKNSRGVKLWWMLRKTAVHWELNHA
jgi:hypothetical protein